MSNTTGKFKSQPKISLGTNTRAVNTVIAVLLMIAIAVGVTAASYFYINSLFEVEEPPLTELLLYRESDKLRVISGPSGEALTWDDIEFSVQDAVLTDDLSGTISAGTEFYITDWVCSEGIPISGDSFVVNVRHKTTNRLIAKYEFSTPGCSGGVTDPAGGGEDPDPWWNGDWDYRKKLTIDHNLVEAPLKDFPVVVHITDGDLLTDAKIDGSDIAFISQDGTIQYDHEIELFDSITGELVAWVDLPGLSASEDTTMYMYYGNAAAASQEAGTATWESNFKMVNHLGGVSIGTTTDSTANKHNPVEIGNPVFHSQGKIGYGVLFTGGDLLQLAASEDFEQTEFSISFWIKNTLGANAGLTIWAYQPINSNNIPAGIRVHDEHVVYGAATGAEWNDFSKISDHQTETWYYITCTYDIATRDMIYYVNGEEDNRDRGIIGYETGALNGDPPTAQLNIGGYLSSAAYFSQYRGTIDELRYSSVAHTPAWITTSYNSQNDPSSFVTVSEEEIPDGDTLYINKPGGAAGNGNGNPVGK
ncbi:MAG: DUF2341 domain-containing protein [Candidatus Lokiarchaeota archaeon]|nr:DUF2341 domain-containing protein [Candidatus Lokiarchaeota archaeon]